jgi:hypothetical protein
MNSPMLKGLLRIVEEDRRERRKEAKEEDGKGKGVEKGKGGEGTIG